MKGKWNNLQKTLPDSNQIGKLVELKIANTNRTDSDGKEFHPSGNSC